MLLTECRPYSTSSSANAGPTRSMSARISDGRSSTRREVGEQYYGDKAGRRDSTGKIIDGRGAYSQERRQSIDSAQPRKGSISEAEAKRRREWAPDRSPLQRLELTLDSITKEEKRARVEEAELLAKENVSRRGSERVNQNSVRFRNRPVAKGPDPSQPEVISSPESSAANITGARDRTGIQQTNKVGKQIPGPEDIVGLKNGKPTDYQITPEPIVSKSTKSSIPQRTPSVGGPGAAAASKVTSTGLGRSPSNKLKKDPPGDPWFNRRVDAERKVRTINPISPRDKELPQIPPASERTSYPITSYESDSDSDLNMQPVQRGNMRKIEQLTGEKPISQAQKLSPGRGEGLKSEAIGRANSQRSPNTAGRTKVAAANGLEYAVDSKSTARQSNQHDHHHFSNILHHRDDDVSGQGVYVPSKRLDEWKKGGVVLLDGEMLDLDAAEKTEAEKDKAWWEAGNTTRRRRSTTSKQRNAEAYDGEYDDSNGKLTQLQLLVRNVKDSLAVQNKLCEYFRLPGPLKIARE